MIALRDAVLLWRPAKPGSGEFRVVRKSDASLPDNDSLECSVGAVFADWAVLSTEARLVQLLAEILTIHHGDGLSLDAMQPELLKIDEVRALLGSDVREPR